MLIFEYIKNVFTPVSKSIFNYFAAATPYIPLLTSNYELYILFCNSRFQGNINVNANSDYLHRESCIVSKEYINIFYPLLNQATY